MKKEDIDFLRELQHELNTQENDGQTAPRYWGICQEKQRLLPKDFGDECILYEGTMYSVKEFVDWLYDNEYDIGREEEWEELDKTDIFDVVSFAEDKLGFNNVYEVSREVIDTIGEDANVFLTKRACLKHIEQNGHHYSKPRTYAMTAWRNPEFERVLNILQTMNIDDIKVTEE